MDMQRFENLYHENYSRVFRTAYLVTNDHQLAEDAAQEAFLKAFAKMETLRDKDKFGSWVSVIAANYSVDLLRKNKKLIITEKTDLQSDPSPESSPHDFWERKEGLLETREALQKLAADDRMLIVLKYYNEMSIKDIATLHNVSPGTIKSRLFRAREKLRVLLQPPGEHKRQLSKSKARPET